MTEYNDPRIFIEETSAFSRFLKYVTIETTSNPLNSASPSSDGQRRLGEMLIDELKSLGLTDASQDSNGYVIATRQGTGSTTVGLVAHLDTSDAFTARDVSPVVHEDYSGQPIQLKNEITISPEDDPKLKQCKGHTLITADGTTLLGADDKAGIAIIMGVLEYLHRHPEIDHPTLRICFTPDEEIGRGADHFPVADFGADFAVTVDGTFLGELNFETFEAYSMEVAFEGVSVHPGYAKGKLVNALRFMGEFLQSLPKSDSPETTDERQGFIHPVTIGGDATKCQVHLIIRDFTEEGAQKHCETVTRLAEDIQAREPRLKMTLKTQFNYPNMMKFMETNEDLVTNLKLAVHKAGISPSVVPIRGGTDGANLSKKGLLTPNLFTGAVNLHGPKEWVSLTNMGYSFCTLMNLLSIYQNARPESAVSGSLND